jgi:UDP-N-acetylenolpyruvoylglucosamine reductase
MVKPFEHPELIDWEPSEHEGLLFYKEGVKCWYRCSGCCYINDRLYHAKMHYMRIHVNKGRPALLKRKYEVRPPASSTREQEQQKKNKKQFDYRRTLLKRGLAMVMTSLGLKKRKHRRRKITALSTTTAVEKPPLAKPVEAKADAEAEAEDDTTVHWTSFFRQDGGEDAAVHFPLPSGGKKRTPVVMATAPSSAFAAVKELVNQQKAALFVFGDNGMTSSHATLPDAIDSYVYFDSLQHTPEQEQPLVVAQNACEHNSHQALQVNLFA